MYLYVIRHGQTEANIQHRYCGQMESPLSEEGRRQAMALEKRLAHISFDEVYASPLSRARDTARLALPHLQARLDPRLMEIDVGRLENQNHFEVAKTLGAEFVRRRDEWDFTAYGGENRAMITARAAGFLQDVAEESERNIAAVCHAGMSCAILMAVLGFPLDRYSLACSNISVAVFEYKNGRWVLQKWNVEGTL